MTEVVFENLERRLISELMLAQKSIKIVVAWLNSTGIIEELCRKLKEGVRIELILHYDEKNESFDFSKFVDCGGKLYWVKSENTTMHAKYCIIDYVTLLHGSCNWTNRGLNMNVENFNITRDEPKLVANYLFHFETLKEKSESSTCSCRNAASETAQPSSKDVDGGQIVSSRMNDSSLTDAGENMPPGWPDLPAISDGPPF